MPPPKKKKKSPLRIIVPFALGIVAVGIAVAVAVNTTRQGGATTPPATPPTATTPQQSQQQAQQTPATTPQTQPQTLPPTSETAPSPATQPTAEAQALAQDQPQAPRAELRGLRAQVFEPGPAPTPLGSLDPANDQKLYLEFDLRGAGVSSLRLADGFTTMRAERAAAAGDPIPLEDHVELQTTLTHGSAFLTPLAASSITINGSTVWLDDNPAGPIWRERSPGVFEAIVLNQDDQPIARVERRYILARGTHNLTLEQHVENLTDKPFTALLSTLGLADMPEDLLGYGGDKRRIRFGYLASPAVDPTRTEVSASAYLIARNAIFGTKDKLSGNFNPVSTVWPTPKGASSGHELVWAGVTNRYFAAVLHRVVADPPADPRSPTLDRVFRQVERVERVLINRPAARPGMFGSSIVNDPLVALSVVSVPLEVPASGKVSQNLGLYAGPLLRSAINRDPTSHAMGISEVVVYNFGGPCAACTFTWLTGPLLALLRFLHSITWDWSLSVILLVVVVRSILHPVTRWSQIRMQRFGKQMQMLAPKQKKLQEKYANDPQKMREEMGKLWREEGVSPAGFLGCLPMLLQSPVWIALYASLYFAFELRHQPAFFGIFQSATNNAWMFLGDLSEPDRIIYFGRAVFSIPLMGSISSFNILPILLGIVFFVHQKYLTPPASAAMTPEQEQQQKMMRWMIVIMFPIFMYNAPSGLALYLITNSVLAILETRWIRAHMDKHQLLHEDNLKAKPKAPRQPPKPGSFMHRMQTMVEQQQAAREQMDKRSVKREPRASRPEPTQRNYKKKR